MPWVLIILIVVVAIGLFGFLSSKVDELSGIGREHTAGSFRWPHGKVVRTRILSAEKEHERGEIAKKVLLPCIVIAAVCAVLTMFGPVVSYGNVLTVVSLLASLVIATLVCGKSDAGRAFCYAVMGLGIACAVLILITRAYVSVSTAEVNAFTAIFGADETVGCVRLSQRTAAAALLLDLQDKEWEVPEHVREQAKLLEKRSKPAPAAATDPASQKDEE